MKPDQKILEKLSTSPVFFDENEPVVSRKKVGKRKTAQASSEVQDSSVPGYADELASLLHQGLERVRLIFPSVVVDCEAVVRFEPAAEESTMWSLALLICSENPIMLSPQILSTLEVEYDSMRLRCLYTGGALSLTPRVKLLAFVVEA